MSRILLMVLLSVCVLLPGCFQPDSGQTPVTPSAKPASNQPKPAQPVETKEETKAEEVKAAPPKKIEWGPNVLRNTTFAEWSEDRPADWNCLEKTADGLKPVKPVRPEDSKALSIPVPVEGEFVQMMQIVPAASVQVGAPLKFGARVKTQEAGQVHLMLSYRIKNDENKLRVVTLEGTEWQNLEYRGSLPKEAVPETVRFFIFRRTATPGEVLIEEPFLSFGIEEVETKELTGKGDAAS